MVAHRVPPSAVGLPLVPNGAVDCRPQERVHHRVPQRRRSVWADVPANVAVRPRVFRNVAVVGSVVAAHDDVIIVAHDAAGRDYPFCCPCCSFRSFLSLSSSSSSCTCCCVAEGACFGVHPSFVSRPTPRRVDQTNRVPQRVRELFAYRERETHTHTHACARAHHTHTYILTDVYAHVRHRNCARQRKTPEVACCRVERRHNDGGEGTPSTAAPIWGHLVSTNFRWDVVRVTVKPADCRKGRPVAQPDRFWGSKRPRLQHCF